MKNHLSLGLVSAIATLTAMSVPAPTLAANLVTTLGEQDFTDGSFLAGGVSDFNAASVGEPAPFDDFQGSDFGTPFSATWTFNFGALSNITNAFLKLGLFDHDSQAPGSQVDSFSLDGNDLTSFLNAALESSGGGQTEYNVYEIALPDWVFADLEDGIGTFTLTLKGPGLQGNAGSLETAPSNGAGLDFSTLTINTQDPGAKVPEPSLVLSLLALGAMGTGSTLKKQLHR
jgi:hypothetical protein